MFTAEVRSRAAARLRAQGQGVIADRVFAEPAEKAHAQERACHGGAVDRGADVFENDRADGDPAERTIPQWQGLARPARLSL